MDPRLAFSFFSLFPSFFLFLFFSNEIFCTYARLLDNITDLARYIRSRSNLRLLKAPRRLRRLFYEHHDGSFCVSICEHHDGSLCGHYDDSSPAGNNTMETDNAAAPSGTTANPAAVDANMTTTSGSSNGSKQRPRHILPPLEKYDGKNKTLYPQFERKLGPKLIIDGDALGGGTSGGG